MPAYDESHTAYCGMFCGDCLVRTANISETANILLEKVTTEDFKTLVAGLPKVIPQYGTLAFYDQFLDVLTTISDLDCEHICREGEGIPHCPIRSCCNEKGVEGCWICGQYKNCEKIDFLCRIHAEAPIKNMDIIKESGMEAFLGGEKYF